MQKEKRGHVLWWYLKERRFAAVLFCVFVGIFAVVFALYGLPMAALLYPALLCLLLGMLLTAARFCSYCKRHKRRQETLKSIELDFARLPEGTTLAEEDCRQMLLALGRINNAHLTESRAREQESFDYYTTWVHQIKTPISVMRMILRSEDTDEHRELSAELFRIEQYVEMVLSYLRLGGEVNDFVFHELELDGVIRQAVHKFAPLFVRKRIRLCYEPTDARVLTDEKWLLFIIEQLLSNAIKYTVSGEVRITVESKVLKISDTGIGIAPEDLPRIFERGFTGYNGRSDKKSTGLGLYLCSQAAQKLSISLKAESAVGVGSVFSLDLSSRPLQVE